MHYLTVETRALIVYYTNRMSCQFCLREHSVFMMIMIDPFLMRIFEWIMEDPLFYLFIILNISSFTPSHSFPYYPNPFLNT